MVLRLVIVFAIVITSTRTLHSTSAFTLTITPTFSSVNAKVVYPYPPTMTTHRTGKQIFSRGEKTKLSRPRSNRATALDSKASSSDDDDDLPTFAWLTALVLPLWLVYISNQWSRSSIYYLVNFSGEANAFSAMNIDLGFSQSQYGLLASVAFTSLFAVASLGAGVASDRYNRKFLTIASAAAWSVATLGTAFSTSYEQVVLWRIAMGLACAFSTPTAYTLLQERVPQDRAALASSIYGTGVALGGALASLSLLLDSELGWRNALCVIGAFGFGAAALNTLLLPDDPKQAAAAALDDDDKNAVQVKMEQSSITDQVFQVLSTSRVKWLFLASFLRFSAGLTIGVWSAAYFRGVFPDNVADYAVAQALITSICGVTSGLVGGIAADWLSSTAVDSDSDDPVGRKLWVPVVGSVLAAPAFYYSVHSGGSFELAMACLAVEYLVAECWFGPSISVLQTTVGPSIGGTAQGLFTLTGAVGNLAPTALGFFFAKAAGVEGGNDAALADLLSVVVCSCYIASATCFAVSSLTGPPPPPASLSPQQELVASSNKKTQ
jgi:MFS family permease